MPDPEFDRCAPPTERAVAQLPRIASTHARRAALGTYGAASPAVRSGLQATDGQSFDNGDTGAQALVTVLWHGRAIWIRAPGAQAAS